jgi:hypothetical protein
MSRYIKTDDGVHIGTISPAKPADVKFTLNKLVEPDGRSKWEWLLLANGELALITFPRGDTYEELIQTRRILEEKN